MQFPVKTGTPTSMRTACAIVPFFEDRRLSGVAAALDKAAHGALRRAVRAREATGKLGRTVMLRDLRGPAQRALLVGCGGRSQFLAKQHAVAVAAATQALVDAGVREALSYIGYESSTAADLDAYAATRATVQTVRACVYRFTELKSNAERAPRIGRIGIALADQSAVADARRGVRHGVAISNAMDLARDLGNRPANVCTPTHIADVATQIAKRYANVEVKVLDEPAMKRLGMGALLSVTSGAGEQAKLIVLSYKSPHATRAAPIVLCGKGVTFDTGGISMKPPAKMDEMKFDMCGAASVIAAVAGAAELDLDTHVVAVVPACENMPSSKATRPGDIVTSMSGKTVEILNTDAEGRLILCDALTYAQKTLKPRVLIDVATLTGACVIALGPLYTGVFTPDDALAETLLACGERALDRAWRLPTDDEYGESLRSNFADFANAGSRDGGASIAAQFLSRFTTGARWAHLDIAGVAWRANAAKGATGRPVPLLIDFLLTDAAAAQRR